MVTWGSGEAFLCLRGEGRGGRVAGRGREGWGRDSRSKVNAVNRMGKKGEEIKEGQGWG